MRSALFTFLAIVLFLAPLQNAEARMVIGGGVIVGAPYYYYPPYYAYPYYAYPPYPVYPPYASPPSPYPLPPPAPQDRYYQDAGGEYCREYNHRITIDGQKREAYGHACRQPDGSWRILD